jgi:hypothetical protein
MACLRKLNQSLRWRALQSELLADDPSCECGVPAAEAHVPGGCFTGKGDATRSEVVALCRACHDATGCTEPPPPSRRFQELFGP